MSCDHMNKDGTFKGGFDGCVLHMQGCEGHSAESAKKICGKIAQQVAAGRSADWTAGLANSDGDETFHKHVRSCPQCKTGALCQKGKTMMMAAIDAGNTATARAGFQSLAMQGIPTEIQWMPPGHHKIIPFVNDEPKQVEFAVDANLCAAFAEQLQRLRGLAAADQGDVPFLDFNHNDDAASGEVTELYWGGDDPRTGGIRAKVNWSAAGRQALEGRNYRRFSPQWELDPDTFQPIGIKVNLGGLVNRAAFRNIQPVVAKSGGAVNNKGNNEMNREEFSQLLADGLKPITERITALEGKATGAAQAAGAAATAAAGAAGEEKLVTLVKEALKPINQKFEAIETAQKEGAKAQAKAAVQAHVARGAIGPEDTERIAFWEAQVLANAAAAEKELSKLPGKRFAPITTSTGSSRSGGGAFPEDRMQAMAKEARKANPTAFASDREALEAYLKTAQGKKDYEEYRDAIINGDPRFPKTTVKKD